MRSRRSTLTVLLLVFGVVLLQAAQPAPPGTQDPKSKASAPAADVLQRAFELAVVRDEHRLLQRLAGTWQVVVRTHVATGGESAAQEPPVQEDRGSVAAQSMLGGRYVVCNFKLQFQDRAFEAVQILGFDTLRSVYTSSWRDDRSTWSVDLEGQADATAAELLVLRGEVADAQDPAGRPFRMQLDLRERDRVVAHLYEQRGEREVLLQEQQWTRP